MEMGEIHLAQHADFVFAMATSSPSDTTSPALLPTPSLTPLTPASTVALEHESLERKRARDRNSQRRMRERTKSTINELTQEVDMWKREAGQLRHALDSERCKNHALQHSLQDRIRSLEDECRQVNMQKSALQLLLANRDGDGNMIMGEGNVLAIYQRVPPHIEPATCQSDIIIQKFICSRWKRYAVQASTTLPPLPPYPESADLGAFFDNHQTCDVDETTSASIILADIVLRYPEIDTLPKKVAVHYVMSTLLKWMVLRTKASYEALPDWLKPIPLQLDVRHPCWIDRIPWPNVRRYLIERNIAFDDFVKAYSVNFDIEWEYDHQHVIMKDAAGTKINPIYEEHIRRLENWTVADGFKKKFPEMNQMIDDFRREAKMRKEAKSAPVPLPPIRLLEGVALDDGMIKR